MYEDIFNILMSIFVIPQYHSQWQQVLRKVELINVFRQFSSTWKHRCR